MTSSLRHLSACVCCGGAAAVLLALAMTVCSAEPENNFSKVTRVKRDVSLPSGEKKDVSPRVDTNSRRYTSHNLSREETIANILNEYESKVPPNYESDIPTDIFVQIYVLSFDTISESSMDYSLTMFLRQSWHDHRMEHEPLKNVEKLELDTKVMSKVWVPDLYFVNEKRASFHDVTVPNRLMHIYPNGTVKYSIRISMTLSCDMNLRKYPFDTQTCSMTMESYGYSTQNAVFHWSDDGVTFRKDLSLPQFELTANKTYDCTASYYGVNYTCIGVSFDLVRSYSYHLAQVYLPSVLIVTLSWVSFWLDIDAVPARISLGLLTVLTMTTQSSGARANLPRVSYIKAIDVWMAMCLFFVFAALVEFAYVNVMSRVERRRQTVNGDKPPPVQAEEGESVKSEQPAEGKANGGRRGRLFRRPFSKSAVRRQKARRLDKISRIVFPSVFVAFNFIYWIFYMVWDAS